eukprot:TRINITY_DN824_c0_g2_i1.p1 TRINITY_DN824_c0_g2~~TRINITY_DN824_c0_g2_i1.p1  ORF type:complete len:1001 (+),score=279.65 TRINITY_DN824_c0_g2_i1:148-3003(+)
MADGEGGDADSSLPSTGPAAPAVLPTPDTGPRTASDSPVVPSEDAQQTASAGSQHRRSRKRGKEQQAEEASPPVLLPAAAFEASGMAEIIAAAVTRGVRECMKELREEASLGQGGGAGSNAFPGGPRRDTYGSAGGTGAPQEVQLQVPQVKSPTSPAAGDAPGADLRPSGQWFNTAAQFEPLSTALLEITTQTKAMAEQMRRASAINMHRLSRRHSAGSSEDEGSPAGLRSPKTRLGMEGASRPVGRLLALAEKAMAGLQDPAQHHLWGELHEANRIQPASAEKSQWRKWYQYLDEVAKDAARWRQFVHARPQTGAAAGCVDGAFHWGEAQVDAGEVDHTVQGRVQQDATLGEHGEIDLDGLFDLTPQRVEQIFMRFDRAMGGKQRGELTRGQFGQALRSQGLPLDPALKDILNSVDVQGNQKVLLPAFHVALRALKMAQLFEFSECSPAAQLDVIDYTLEKDKPDMQCPVDDLEGFFFGHRPANSMRWVHVRKADQQMLLRLTVKYHLHPLGVQDAWDLLAPEQERSSEEVKTKVDRYGNHYVVLLCKYFLAPRWEQACNQLGPLDLPPKVDVGKLQVCVFLAGPPHWDTIITIPERGTGLHDDDGRRDSQSEGSDGSEAGGFCAEREGPAGLVWQEMQQMLLRPRTRAREARCDFLMHEIFSDAVEELRPIVNAYRKRLSCFQDRLDQMESSFEQRHLNEVSSMGLEMGKFLRAAVRPLRHSIRRCQEASTISAETSTYMTESLERLEVLADDVSQLMDLCKAMPEEFKAHSDKKLNNTLFALTLATVLFMPAQLLAGVYGMNFVDDEGNPGIPELRWKYGYLYFWLTVLGMVAVLGMTAWWVLRDKRLAAPPPKEPERQRRRSSALPLAPLPAEATQATPRPSTVYTFQQTMPAPAEQPERAPDCLTPQSAMSGRSRGRRRRSTVSFMSQQARDAGRTSLPGQVGHES